MAKALYKGRNHPEKDEARLHMVVHAYNFKARRYWVHQFESGMYKNWILLYYY